MVLELLPVLTIYQHYISGIREDLTSVIMGDPKFSYLGLRDRSGDSHHTETVSKMYQEDTIAHFTHTSAYASWEQVGKGVLWYILDNPAEQSPIFHAADKLHHETPGSFLLYYTCRGEEGESTQRDIRGTDWRRIPLKVPLALIISHIRLECTQEGMLDLVQVEEKLRDLENQGILLKHIWTALNVPTTPISSPMSELLKILNLSLDTGAKPIIAIDNMEALDNNGLPQ